MKKTKALVAILLVFCIVLLTACGGDEQGSTSSKGSVPTDNKNETGSLITNDDFYLSSDTLNSDNPADSSDMSSGSTTSVFGSSNGGIGSSSVISGGNSSTGQSSFVYPRPPVDTTSSFSFKGIWISFNELNMKGLNASAVKAKIDTMMKNVKNQGYNAVFGQVRPYADAVYPSAYFPYSSILSGTEGKNPGYDLLKIMIDSAKKYGLQFHAWINPYRVRSSYPTAYNPLAEDNIAKEWLNDGSNRAIAAAGGLYLNPASTDVQKLVINGVEEILKNYDVDGIHFDDYFYPTTDASFDKAEYDAYKNKTSKPLSLGDWRRANVNALVSAVYSLCHKYSGVQFGISPAGDISTNHTDQNYTQYYADIPKWMANKGYVDYITPQLYQGYNYPNKKFAYDTRLNIWASLPRHSSLKIYIGLGAYKIGDTTATDKADWCDSKGDLLARQVKDAKAKNTHGFCVFSYEASVSTKSLNVLQIKNMFEALK